MTTWICTRSSNELQHHGIKGMKWGVRRFQNKDGSLTSAGRRRYDEGEKSESISDKIEKKAKNIGATTSRENTEKESKRYKIPENKSLHRLKLEEKYRANGMTLDEAEQAAAKRIRSEKFVAGAAAVTVASAVAYAKYKGYSTDKTIKANSDFQRIMRLTEDAEIRKDYRQYVTIDKKDKVLYKGMFGDHLEQLRSSNEKIYDVTVRNTRELKVASEKRARETFVNLFKNDSEFRKEFLERVEKDELDISKDKLESIYKKVLNNGNSLSDKELKGKVYDLFNVMLAQNNERADRNSGRFYEALRKQGINAVVDINDSRINNYHAKMPLILFGDDFENVKKRVMEYPEIQENINKHMNRAGNQSNMLMGASLVGMFASIPVHNKARVDRGVIEYKRSHPNTKMTDAEIEAMIKEQLTKK